MKTDFEEIYTKYARRLYLFIYAKCRNHEMTEDILQTTFLKAIENIDSFRGECDIYTWLCKIAINTLFSEIKAASRTCSLEALMEDGSRNELSDDKPNPSDIVIKKEEQEELYRRIEHLPDKWKKLVKLRLHNLSFREIAEQFGKTENWAKVNFNRAKKRLMKGMKEYDRL